MYFAPKEIKLKDGRTALLRSPVPSDAAEMLRYLEITAQETPFLLRSPGENTMTLEQETTWLESGLTDKSKFVILCFVDGRLAGNCQIVRKTKLKNRHRATIGIAIVKDFWNLGIGTAMFKEMTAIAESWGILQMELEVFEGNDRAIALYRKMGFETVSHVPNAARMPDGTFLKEYLMIKALQK